MIAMYYTRNIVMIINDKFIESRSGENELRR